MIKLLCDDLFRIEGRISTRLFLKRVIFDPRFRFIFWFRVASQCPRFSLRGFLPYLAYRRHSRKNGFEIPVSVKIGGGLYFPHAGGIVINSRATIGRNCNILHGVTIGNNLSGGSRGVPTIGDNVYIGPGAVIVGGITIGSHSVIAGNAFVNRSVPSHSVVFGNPAKLIQRQDASLNFIKNAVKLF